MKFVVLRKQEVPDIEDPEAWREKVEELIARTDELINEVKGHLEELERMKEELRERYGIILEKQSRQSTKVK